MLVSDIMKKHIFDVAFIKKDTNDDPFEENQEINFRTTLLLFQVIH